MLPERKIIHVDMDAFYASVEQRDQPSLRGRPVVVGGSPDSRGVVASASYEARRYGIRSAMSCKKAYRLCPDTVFVYPRFEKYREASRQIREIFLSVTPKVEPLSLDEAYLDVTENLLNEPLARKIAMHVKEQIYSKTGLTASAGVGPNKFIAKVASDLRKPNGLVVIPPARVASFVEPLPVEKLWGVGPATTKKLHELGLRVAGDIKRAHPAELEKSLGKFGLFLYELAHGEDHREVESDWDPKSSGSEVTFEKDVLDIGVLEEALTEQLEENCAWLKKNDRLARTVTLKVRYKDFTTITRSRTLAFPSDKEAVFLETVRELLENTEAGSVPVRLIGASLSGLLHRDEPHQLWFEFVEKTGSVNA
jgi:DNA polymerase-4